jgi:hypothetical protein
VPDVDAKLILALLGPLFLVLALQQRLRRGSLQPSGRAWLRVGLIFVAVAAWLWWQHARR